jgi:hypothetical protein
MISCTTSMGRCSLACRPTKKVCFGCMKIFEEDDAEYCHNCTEWKCPHCGICGCLVEEETLRAIRAIVKTYELWIEGGMR